MSWWIDSNFSFPRLTAARTRLGSAVQTKGLGLELLETWYETCRPQAPALRDLHAHNLDLAFNSLDAQREACEPSIKSQAHEGWRLMCDKFDKRVFAKRPTGHGPTLALLKIIRRKG